MQYCFSRATRYQIIPAQVRKYYRWNNWFDIKMCDMCKNMNIAFVLKQEFLTKGVQLHGFELSPAMVAFNTHYKTNGKPDGSYIRW